MSTSLSLLDALAQVPDPRSRHGKRHPLTALLALAVLAMLTGCKTYAAIEQFGRDHGIGLAHLLGFRRKTPCASSFCVLFAKLDVRAFEAVLSNWITPRLSPEQARVIHLDGKTARGSRDGEIPGQHFVAAYAASVQGVLGQLRVDSKTNEHKAALELLGIVPIRGHIFTGDALFCQRDLCAHIIDGGGDYVFTVKDNQPSLAVDIRVGLGYAEQARQTAAAFSPRWPGAAPTP